MSVSHQSVYMRYTKCYIGMWKCYRGFFETPPAPVFTLQCTPFTRKRNALLWRHNGRQGVSNHQPHDCLLSRLFRRRSKKTPKLRVTGLCAGNSPVTGEFPAQRASDAENIFIWWRHHDTETLSVLLATCEWNKPVTDGFSKRTCVMQSFDVCFAVRYNSMPTGQHGRTASGWMFYPV